MELAGQCVAAARDRDGSMKQEVGDILEAEKTLAIIAIAHMLGG